MGKWECKEGTAFSRTIQSRADHQRAPHAGGPARRWAFALPRIACVMSFMPEDAINDDVCQIQALRREHPTASQYHRGDPQRADKSGHSRTGDGTRFLHFRKALEEIAFSSLCANVDQYTAAYKGVTTVWSAKRLLEGAGKANRKFLGTRQPTVTDHIYTRELCCV